MRALIHFRLGFICEKKFLGVLLLLAIPAWAGGPRYVAGVSYFNAGTAGAPLTWAQGVVNYYTDQGDLSAQLPGPSADAFVASAFSRWTSITTAAITANRAGQLAEDVNGTQCHRECGWQRQPSSRHSAGRDQPARGRGL